MSDAWNDSSGLSWRLRTCRHIIFSFNRVLPSFGSQ